MTEEKDRSADSREGLQEVSENPYDPEKRKPEDIVRLFYIHNNPLIPVVSRRNVLIGILKKDDVIAELSDIERVDKLSIDGFITSLAKKMTFEELLPYGENREFAVINIFGELQGSWPRLRLFSAVENQCGKEDVKDLDQDVAEQKDQQILEWIIYLVLEHIPRGLYAVNKKGKTIFFNSHFEEMIETALQKPLEPEFIESAFKDAGKNEMVTGPRGDEICFYNRELGLYYEKIPMINKKKTVGYLVFTLRESEVKPGLKIPGVDIRGMALSEMLEAFERSVIVELLNDMADQKMVADALKVSRKALQGKIAKHGIHAGEE